MSLPGTFACAMAHAFRVSYSVVLKLTPQERLMYIALLGDAGYPLAGTQAKLQQMQTVSEGCKNLKSNITLKSLGLPHRS